MFGNPITKIEKLAAKGKNAKLVPYMESKKKEIRIAAVKAVDSDRCEEAYNKLTSMRYAADKEERLAVIEALGNSKHPGAATLLTQDVAKEKDEEIVAAMRAAIIKVRK